MLSGTKTIDNQRTKILFIYALDASYIKNDLVILSNNYDVKELDLRKYQGSLKKKIIYAPKILFEFIRGIMWSNLVFVWFADVHALIAVSYSKILKKKSIVVVGGYEVVRAPEIGYGGMLNRGKSKIIKFTLRNADEILAVSKNTKNEIKKWVNRSAQLVYNCVDTNKFKPGGNKESIVITVGQINRLTIKKKGIEDFVRTAKYLPNTTFIVIGRCSDNAIEGLRSIASKNVTFAGFINEEDLIKQYQRAKVYCQLSFHESFGVAVAEAMACGCIPVVTDRGALPEVVGDCGFYVHYGDEKEAAEAIKKALEASTDVSEKVRERVKFTFSIEIREAELKKVIAEVLK